MKTVEFVFSFHGDDAAARQFLRMHGAGTGIALYGAGDGVSGRVRLDEIVAAGAHAADVWSQLRLYGETAWEEPEALWEALAVRNVGAQQRFQWLGAEALMKLPSEARQLYERQPPVSLSLAVDDAVPLAEVLRLWREHPLHPAGDGWMALLPWGRGHGVVVEANPFASRADAEVYFAQVRDLARRVPVRADKWGLRSVRAWLPLAACRSLLNQLAP